MPAPLDTPPGIEIMCRLIVHGAHVGAYWDRTIVVFSKSPVVSGNTVMV
jgi:hypothetical protein